MDDKKLAALLFKHPAYNVVGHVRPDGDCVGSQLAIFNILMARNIKCNIIKNGNYGSILSPFVDGYAVVSDTQFDPTLPLICVDCSDFKRVGVNIREKYDKPYLNIDHHISNDKFADHNIVDASASSAAQVIAEALIRENIDFDKKTAEMLYLGIMTDSNRFAYDTTTLDTIKVVATLVAKGIRVSKIFQKVYERDTLQKYALLERFLRNVTVFENGRCCMSFITEKDFMETGAELLDTEGFVNYTRQIRDVEVGAFLEFHDNYVKCSLRSKDAAWRMDLLAKEFGGGGHPAAAGFIIEHKDPAFYSKFRSTLAEHVKNILLKS
ncbi:MAG: DHH family phosphoesterase [Puniceicoccales bacterium]|jgi:phosphoesterase RecJ-like protein|nr:DHH family phosphoesterase [Puniceicoccales bacterium]